MGRYTPSARGSARIGEQKQVAPIWRGIGCIMMLVIPVVSYFLAMLTVNGAVEQGLPVPYQLIGHPVMPPWLYQTGLAPIADFIASQQNLYGNLLVGVLYVVIFGGIISVFWAFLYKA